MKRIYDTGLADNSPISMGVNVVTVGVAYTAVYLVRSGGQSTLIAESTHPDSNAGDTEPNGDIANFEIGKAVSIRKSYIVCRTLIDLTHLEENERKREVDLLRVIYRFFGGFSGMQLYNFDADDIIVSPGYKFVSITKPVEML